MPTRRYCGVSIPEAPWDSISAMDRQCLIEHRTRHFRDEEEDEWWALQEALVMAERTRCTTSDCQKAARA
jgi:hypothetical protein